MTKIIVKINLNDELKNFDGEIVPAMKFHHQAQKFYDTVLAKIKEYENEPKINSIFSLLKEAMKGNFKPFIFQEHLQNIINNAMSEPVESLTKGEILELVLSEKGKDIEEFKIINRLKKILHSDSEILEITKKKELKLITDRLINVNGVDPDSLNIFTCELLEVLESE